MSNVMPHARWSHRPGVIQVDVPAPELSLSAVRPVGVHLVLLLETAEALSLARQLDHVLAMRGRISGEAGEQPS
jgi:hypothetical protein